MFHAYVNLFLPYFSTSNANLIPIFLPLAQIHFSPSNGSNDNLFDGSLLLSTPISINSIFELDKFACFLYSKTYLFPVAHLSNSVTTSSSYSFYYSYSIYSVAYISGTNFYG